MTRRALLLAAGLVVVSVAPSVAQPSHVLPGPHRLEVDLGGLWLGGVDFGRADATLTRNQSAPGDYTLFTTSGRLSSTGGVEGRVGFHVTRTLALESAFIYSRPALETRVSGDVEGAAAVTARDRLSQFTLDVSGVVHMPKLRIGRAVPFVLGGAGYLRELHEGGALVETGHTFHAGGGVKLPLVVRRGLVRAVGLRIDGRLYMRAGGVDFDRDEPVRVFGAGGASVAIEF